MPFTPFEISAGNFYNVPVKTYYIEADTDTASLTDAPVGSIAIVNEANNFHMLMLDSSGNWNTI